MESNRVIVYIVFTIVGVVVFFVLLNRPDAPSKPQEETASSSEPVNVSAEGDLLSKAVSVANEI